MLHNADLSCFDQWENGRLKWKGQTLNINVIVTAFCPLWSLFILLCDNMLITLPSGRWVLTTTLSHLTVAQTHLSPNCLPLALNFDCDAFVFSLSCPCLGKWGDTVLNKNIAHLWWFTLGHWVSLRLFYPPAVDLASDAVSMIWAGGSNMK